MKMVTKSKFYGLMPEIIDQLMKDGWLEHDHAYWNPSNNIYSDGSMGYSLAVKYNFHRYSIVNGLLVMNSSIELSQVSLMKEEITRIITELLAKHNCYTPHIGVNDTTSSKTEDSLVVRCMRETGRYFQGPIKPSAYMLNKIAMGEGAPSRRQLIRQRRTRREENLLAKQREEAIKAIERAKNPFERVFG